MNILSSEFIDAVLAAFVDIVFVIFVSIAFVTIVDTLSTAFVISSHTIIEVLAILFKNLLFSQIHVLRFQL